MIRATSRPAARETHPMGSSRGGISLASAARGSVAEVMILARPASKASSYSTSVLSDWDACFLGSCAARLRQFLTGILPIPEQRLLAESIRQFFSPEITFHQPNLLHQPHQGVLPLASVAKGAGEEESALSHKPSCLDSSAACSLFSTSSRLFSLLALRSTSSTTARSMFAPRCV